MSGTDAAPNSHSKTHRASTPMAVALLVAAVVFVVQFIAPQTLGEQVRRHVEQKLREHYPELSVSIGRGYVDPKVGLVLNDIEFRLPEPGTRLSLRSRSRSLLKVEQIVLVTSTDLERIKERSNPIVAERMIILGATANAWMERDRCSLQRLWPPPKFGSGQCPRVELRNAKIAMRSEPDGEPVELDIDEAVLLKHFGSGEGGSTCATTISATGGSGFCDRIEANAKIVGSQTQFRTKLTAVRFSDELVRHFPLQWQSHLTAFRGLSLLFDTEVNAQLGNHPPRFSARTAIHDGQFQNPRSPIPVRQIQGLVTANQEAVTIETCQATWGDARIRLHSEDPFSLSTRDGAVSLSATNLMLDQRVASVIPRELLTVWNKFEPRGMIDIDRALLRLTNGKLQTEADVTCKGMNLRYEKFPYPIKDMTGTFVVRGGRAKSELMSGWVGGRLLNCLFDVPIDAARPSEKVFSCALDGPIAIDSELLQSLSPRGAETTKLESFIRSLHPLGSVHLRHATFRTDRRGGKHQTIELAVSDGSLRFENFPYPLYNVHGEIQVSDGEVSLVDFQGSNSNGAAISCGGRYQIPGYSAEWSTDRASSLAGEAGRMLELSFSGSRVALDEALRSSLPQPSQQTWDTLRPSGVLDSLEIDLSIDAPGKTLGLELSARQFESQTLGNDAIRLHPASMPYRLDIVDGAVRFQRGEVFIDSVRAEHGRSTVSADGGCRRLPNGQWLLALNIHNGSRLIPDSELINALPREMRGAMRGLNLRGPVGFSGLSETLLSNQDHPQPSFIWDLDLQLEGNRIGDVGPVHSLRGELSIRGDRNVNGLRAEGEVRIDSMHVNDLQLTQIRGPYRMKDDRLMLGQNVSAEQTVRPIEGRLFDGAILTNGNVKLSDGSFDVALAVRDAKVPVLLADLGYANSELSGTLNGTMAMEGILGTTDLLSGNGRATVDDANLYELPVLVQLLNVLSISPSEDHAFTNADVQYKLIEDQVVFDELNLWGSLIALHGSGTLDRRHEVDLSFNTRVSPRNTFRRLFRPLGDQRYTLWTVEVNGPLSDLNIERRALDAVGQTLERLFPGMNTGVEAKRKDRTAGLGKMFH